MLLSTVRPTRISSDHGCGLWKLVGFTSGTHNIVGLRLPQVCSAHKTIIGKCFASTYPTYHVTFQSRLTGANKDVAPSRFSTEMSLTTLPCSVVAALWPEQRVLLGLSVNKHIRKVLRTSKKTVLLKPTADKSRKQIRQHRKAIAASLADFTKRGMPVRMVWHPPAVSKGNRAKRLSMLRILCDVICRAHAQAGGSRLNLFSLDFGENMLYFGEKSDSTYGQQLLSALRDYTDVDELTLTDVRQGLDQLGGDAAYDIFSTLSLRKLAMNNVVSTWDVEGFAQRWSGWVGMKELSVSMAWDGAARGAYEHVLCNALPRNLKALALEKGVWPDGAEVEEALAFSAPQLERLRVARSAVSDTAAPNLAKALPLMRALTTLELAHNRLTEAGFQILSEAVGKMPSLQVLDLSYNKSSAAGIAALIDGLRHSATIREVILRGSDHKSLSSVVKVQEECRDGHSMRVVMD